MRGLRARLAVLIVSASVVAALPATPAHAAPAGCGGAPAEPTVEERRLAGAVPREILRRAGFDTLASEFTRALCRADSHREAEHTVRRHARNLWERAVARAQGRGPAGGDLSRDDDRPLYWARLGMTLGLRQWQPSFPLTGTERAALLARLESASRGRDALAPPPRTGQGRTPGRVLVTGFDPFTLDRDIRISNPSGAAALALDGTVIETGAGPVRVEAAVFPVRWGDFADGTVERTLRPALPGADLFATVSQGRPGRFDIERYNGAWRGGFPDNENVSETGTVPVGDPSSQPQWTATTLPHAAIAAAPTGRFPVYDNTQVTEVPAGSDTPVVRPEGPTPGSLARGGSGGNYLSNEIAYRATLLRDRLGLGGLPGGHVHTPVLQFGAGNTDPATGAVTDPEFVRNRLDIIDQVREILRVAVEN
ncbi:hypothetical protein GCM10027168_48730 [Streptomyces capparidis]